MSMFFYFCWMDFIAHFLQFLGDKSVRDMLVFPKRREMPWVFWIQIFHHLHCRFELGHVVLVQLVGRFPDLERSLVGKPPQDDRTSLGAAIQWPLEDWRACNAAGVSIRDVTDDAKAWRRDQLHHTTLPLISMGGKKRKEVNGILGVLKNIEENGPEKFNFPPDVLI